MYQRPNADDRSFDRPGPAASRMANEPAAGGSSATPIPTPDASPNPPAASYAAGIGGLIEVVNRLEAQQRAILDNLRPAPRLPPASPLRLDADDVRALVADAMRQHQLDTARHQTRDAFVREHLSDLPEAYRRLMPSTADAVALADAEQAIRRQYRTDLQAARHAATPASAGRPDSASWPALSGGPAATPVPDIGGDEPGGLAPAAAIDYVKLSPLQQVAVGLRGSPPRQPAAPAPATTPLPAATAPSVAPPPPHSLGRPEPFGGRRDWPNDADDDALFVGAD